MGSGTYATSYDSKLKSHIRADLGKHTFYSNTNINDTFQQRDISNKMSPHLLGIRESRDSEEHPNSVPIIIGLDVTGSMGRIPHSLIKTGLPHMMGSIIQNGIKDPQVLFLGVGDHTCDRSPIQVSQFESSDKLLDQWLEKVWLEGGGGGNDGESYHLAWYIAARHTKTDSFEKRKQKGFIFTIGDEPVLKTLTNSNLINIFGPGQYNDDKNLALSLLEEAKKEYHIFHIHTTETYSGQRISVQDSWKQILSENCLMVDDHKDIPNLIAKTISENINESIINFNNDKEIPAKEINVDKVTEEEIFL